MKRRMKVSNDDGKTWKTRWIDPMQFNPRSSELNEGELVWVNGIIHKVIVKDGRLTCPPRALVEAMKDDSIPAQAKR